MKSPLTYVSLSHTMQRTWVITYPLKIWAYSLMVERRSPKPSVEVRFLVGPQNENVNAKKEHWRFHNFARPAMNRRPFELDCEQGETI
jgi:hypothetical protein